MLLRPIERVILLNLLPQQGGLLTMKTVQEARRAIELSEDELERFGYIEEEIPGGAPGQKRIDFTLEDADGAPLAEEDYTVDIQLSKGAYTLIAEQLRELDRNGQLTLGHLDIFDKWFPTSGEAPAEPVRLPTAGVGAGAGNRAQRRQQQRRA